MTEDKKSLPKDLDSDYSLPGRFEESNEGYFDLGTKPKQNKKPIWVVVVAILILSSGFFSIYLMNQNDSREIQSSLEEEFDQSLIKKYDVGKYGSDHDHAAIAVFLDDKPINFALPKFQLSSKYIHFENHNNYLIHKHATGVPLEILFSSFGMKITSDCIIFEKEDSLQSSSDRFCEGSGKSLSYFVNGEPYYSDISLYEIEHRDRILISLSDSDLNSKQLQYLDSLRIPGTPKEEPDSSGNEIIV